MISFRFFVCLFVDCSDPLLQAYCSMTWVGDRWSDDLVETVLIRCRSTDCDREISDVSPLSLEQLG